MYGMVEGASFSGGSTIRFGSHGSSRLDSLCLGHSSGAFPGPCYPCHGFLQQRARGCHQTLSPRRPESWVKGYHPAPLPRSAGTALVLSSPSHIQTPGTSCRQDRVATTPLRNMRGVGRLPTLIEEPRASDGCLLRHPIPAHELFTLPGAHCPAGSRCLSSLSLSYAPTWFQRKNIHSSVTGRPEFKLHLYHDELCCSGRTVHLL